jgi:hypothetical protein
MDHLHAFRLYRGTSVERAGFSPPAESYGMKFWDTDEDAIYRWDGTQWVLPVPRAHDILSAPHPDTTPAPVVRGDLMTGQGLAPTWQRLAHPGAAQRLLESTATESQWAATDDGDAANTVVRTDANTAIIPNRLGIGTPAPNQDSVIAQAETADPAGGGAGTTRIYPKDDGGQSKYYFMDDAGSVYEIAGILENVTVTVGAAGDFAAIQDAVDWMKNWIIKGACVISEIDEGTYDEAVDFSSILIAPGASLTLQGDARVLAGITYVVGAVCNRAALANGGTFNDANPCAIVVNAAGDRIIIGGGTVDPDFDADGWVAGDRILFFGNDDTIYERVINSISPGGAGNNVIEITVALPGAAFPGGGGALDDGSAVALVPNRAIERTAAGACVTVNGVKGVVIDGWYLETSTGASCRGVSCIYGASATVNNTLVQAEDEAIYSSAQFASLLGNAGAVSVWGAASGFYANNVAQCLVPYSVAIDCTYGYRCQAFSFLQSTYGIATHCTAGFHLSLFAHTYCAGGCARQNTTGYYCEKGSYMEANVTDRYNNGNGADYSPNDANPLPKYVQGNGYGVIYMSN